MPAPSRSSGPKRAGGRGASRGGSRGPAGRGGGRPSFGGRGDSGGRFMRKKTNRFYTVFPERAASLDYKDADRLSKFLTEKGKILPRRISGVNAKQQRLLTRAIKKARHAGLLAFQAE